MGNRCAHHCVVVFSSCVGSSFTARECQCIVLYNIASLLACSSTILVSVSTPFSFQILLPFSIFLWLYYSKRCVKVNSVPVPCLPWFANGAKVDHVRNMEFVVDGLDHSLGNIAGCLVSIHRDRDIYSWSSNCMKIFPTLRHLAFLQPEFFPQP